MTDTDVRPIDELMALSPEARKEFAREMYREFMEDAARTKQAADDAKKAAAEKRAAEKKERERLLATVQPELALVFDALQSAALPRAFTKKVEGPGGQELQVDNGQGYYLTGEIPMQVSDGTTRMCLVQFLVKYGDTKLRQAQIVATPTVLAGLVGDPDAE